MSFNFLNRKYRLKLICLFFIFSIVFVNSRISLKAKNSVSQKINSNYSPISSLAYIKLSRINFANLNKEELENKVSELSQTLSIRKIKNRFYLGGIGIESNKNNPIFQDTNLLISNLSNDFYSINVPLEYYTYFYSNYKLDEYEIDIKVSLLMNKVKHEIGLDSMLNSNELSKIYKGNGVLIGIIDGGFDIQNPVFKSSNSSTLRILKLWNQNSYDKNNPQGFHYGDEIVGDALYKYSTDNEEESHGTHVSSIAAGLDNFSTQSSRTSSNFSGIAPEANLIMVSPKFDHLGADISHSSIADAISYIFQKAEKLQMPCVINMSLGTNLGPHDGTSVFDKFVDQISGPGKIICAAAGNSGSDSLHISKTFDKNSKYLRTFARSFDPNESYIYGRFASFDTLKIRYLVKTKTAKQKDTLIYSSEYKYFPDSFDEYELNYDDQKYAYGFVNFQRYNDSISRFSILFRTFLGVMGLEISSNSGTIHLWNCGYGGASGRPFFANNTANFENGDVEYTVTEIGGTAKRIISTGAYISQQSMSNYFGKSVSYKENRPEEDLADFSSHGPTSDNRIKPDICAPGAIVISTINSYDENFYSTGYYKSYIYNMYNKNDYSVTLAGLYGTSMASPVVCGSIALMLQFNSSLTPEQIKYFLAMGARMDYYTGDSMLINKNIWGYGKLNINNTLRILEFQDPKAFNQFSMNINTNLLSFNQIDLNINSTEITTIQLSIYDVLGNNIELGSFEVAYGDNFKTMNLPNLSKGMYFLQAKSDRHRATSKIIR